MIVLGLTGSIGMGKSTTLAMFADEGVPVYSADAAVHDLYESDAAPMIEAAFPGTVIKGKVDRTRLSAAVFSKPDELKRLRRLFIRWSAKGNWTLSNRPASLALRLQWSTYRCSLKPAEGSVSTRSLW